MKTVIVSIGNSDNKLTQQQWAEFVGDVDTRMKAFCKIHFFAGSSNWLNWLNWQNVVWIADIDEKYIDLLKSDITKIRKRFNQDSAAFIVSETEFI